MKQSTEPFLRGLRLPVACLAVLAFSAAAVAVDMPTVVVGNPGNAPIVSGIQQFGSVAYTYRIGKYEVTAGQYTEFLNAVARTDAYGLYNVNMDTAVDAQGCNILRSGTPGNYSYAIAPDWANRPVNYVSWGDAARFANWMHNGQPATGVQDATTTEGGSYPLNGATTNAALYEVAREPSATWVLPGRDEWYKAAYHKNDGVTGNYWLYPTSSDEMPGNLLGDPIDLGNTATYYVYPDGYTIGSPYWRTEVGEHENSAGPYGTYDQCGNVAEWAEGRRMTIVGLARDFWGGTFNAVLPLRDWNPVERPTSEWATYGFRLALVPEPGCVLLLVCGVGAWAVRSRRRVTR